MFTFKDFNVTFEEATLSNGVPVVLFRRKGMPIHLQIAFAAGSRFDPVGKEGLAHFTEHMIVSGSKKFPSKIKIASHVAQLGAAFGASTSKDILKTKFEVVGKEDFKEIAILMEEFLSNSLFDENTIERERGAIISEIGMLESSPARKIGIVGRNLYFQGTNLARNVSGSKESVASISKDDIKNYYSSMLGSSRAVIVLSGDIGMGDVIDQLESKFKLRKSEKFSFGEMLPIIREKATLALKYPGQNQVRIMLGFRVCGIKDEDALPLAGLASIVGGGKTAALNKKLRYEKGLVYSVSASMWSFPDGGVWDIYTSTPKEKVQQVIDIILEEIKRVSSGEITEEEFVKDKKRVLKSTRRRMQTSSAWVRRHIIKELYGDHTRYPDFLNKIDSLQLVDIKRVGKKYFKPGTWYLAMAGDIDEDSVKINY